MCFEALKALKLVICVFSETKSYDLTKILSELIPTKIVICKGKVEKLPKYFEKIENLGRGCPWERYFSQF